MKNSQVFAKIPRDIFYNSQHKYKMIGRESGFVIYCLLTSRKSMNNKIHISLKDIIKTTQVDTNSTRARKKVVKVLNKLRSALFISYKEDLSKIKLSQIFVIRWIEQFRNEKAGWIKFKANDFEIFQKIGAQAYTIMWLLRMYTNKDTKTSFIPAKAIAKILQYSYTTVFNTISLFEQAGLFEVSRGEYYYDYKTERNVQMNNAYRYTGNTDTIMSLSEDKVQRILKRRE